MVAALPVTAVLAGPAAAATAPTWPPVSGTTPIAGATRVHYRPLRPAAVVINFTFMNLMATFAGMRNYSGM